MTTPKQSVAELADLHETYCPLLDDLVAAALLLPLSPTPRGAWWSSVGLSTATKDPTVLEEQRQAKLIWTLGKIAWGDVAGARLLMMKAGPDELMEVADILQHRRLDDAHRAALIGCCVRSKRLSEYLTRPPSRVAAAAHKGELPSSLAEKQCREWLTEKLKARRTETKPVIEDEVFVDEMFPGLTGKGFDRALKDAKGAPTTHSSWHRPGPVNSSSLGV